MFGDRKKMKKIKMLETHLRAYVSAHPWMSVGIAIVAGFVVGKLTLGGGE